MTCRFCKLSEYDDGNMYPMVMYAARHHAHVDCGLKKLGVDFFRKLRRHGYRLNNFPAIAAHQSGLLRELKVLAGEQNAMIAEREEGYAEAQERSGILDTSKA